MLRQTGTLYLLSLCLFFGSHANVQATLYHNVPQQMMRRSECDPVIELASTDEQSSTCFNVTTCDGQDLLKEINKKCTKICDYASSEIDRISILIAKTEVEIAAIIDPDTPTETAGLNLKTIRSIRTYYAEKTKKLDQILDVHSNIPSMLQEVLKTMNLFPKALVNLTDWDYDQPLDSPLCLNPEKPYLPFYFDEVKNFDETIATVQAEYPELAYLKELTKEGIAQTAAQFKLARKVYNSQDFTYYLEASDDRGELFARLHQTINAPMLTGLWRTYPGMKDIFFYVFASVLDTNDREIHEYVNLTKPQKYVENALTNIIFAIQRTQQKQKDRKPILTAPDQCTPRLTVPERRTQHFTIHDDMTYIIKS